MLEAVRARDALLGQTITWAGGTARGAGIDAHGRLLVDTADGRQALNAGEVHLGAMSWTELGPAPAWYFRRDAGPMSRRSVPPNG